jgi:hypothetical protein
MYAIVIQKMAPEADARLVEAWMLLECGTLDDLSIDRFRHEVRVALSCIAEATPEQSEALATSYGL